MKLVWWKVVLWWKRQLLKEASQMSRAHWNIARNELEDHIRRKP